MFYLYKIFTFLSDIKYSGNLFIQDWNDSLDDALSRLHVPCVCLHPIFLPSVIDLANCVKIIIYQQD